MIALIDYRAGNLTSVRKALAACAAPVFTPQNAAELATASAIIVPGVGHFAATSVLDRSWIEHIRAAVGRGAPLLGICLGMQWLYEGSEESPELPGLGLLKGRCQRLRADAETNVKIPHVGWNNLDLDRQATVVDGVVDGSQVYFTHSYAAPVTPETVASTTHGSVFASIVQSDRVAGVQFHPEKSGDVGLRILKNWLALIP
ncbi:MAG TPA: imidazole glycerol phosphate synthase subunit HisH [Vicinamibacterales bacterium]|nr:imidazole glycerol phosphate synthase subunit HisH [Vicinamibacterales bacterium]